MSGIPQVPPPPDPAGSSPNRRNTGLAPPGAPGQPPEEGAPLDEGSARGDTPSTAYWVPWRWPEAIAVMLIAQVLVLVVLSVVAAVAPDLVTPLQAPLSGLTFSVATVGWVAARHGRHWRRLLGPLPASWRDLPVGMGHGVAGFVVVVLGFGTLLQVVADRMGIELPPVQQALDDLARNPETLPYLAVAVVLLAPVGEELFFRGLLFQSLRRRVHLWPAIGLSGVAFAVVHLEPLAMLMVFPLGMWFAWVFHRTGSLLAAVVAHATFNSIVLAAMVVAPQLPESGV